MEAPRTPPEIVIGAGIVPDGDLVFTSIDAAGRRGELNRFVIEVLGVSPEVFPFPTESELGAGFAVRQFGKLAPVVFVVTVDGRRDVADLVRDNLTKALTNFDTGGRRLWIPLMGTGAGGLSPTASAEATARALADSEVWSRSPPEQILVSAAPAVDRKELLLVRDAFQSVIDRFTGDSGIGVRLFNQPAVEKVAGKTKGIGATLDVKLEKNEAKFEAEAVHTLAVVAPERAYFDNDQRPTRDSLNVRRQAEIFTRLITARDVKLPLSIGLFGNWGVGKSYFMDLIRDEIRALTERQPADDERSTYVRRVAQISFNAWHYIDSDLWACLAIRIFDGLAEQIAGDDARLRDFEQIRSKLRAEIQSSEQSKLQAENKQASAQLEREAAALELDRLRADRETQAERYGRLRFARVLATGRLGDRLEKTRKLAQDLGLGEVVKTADDAARLAEQLRALDGRARGVLAALGAQFSTPARAGLGLLAGFGFIAAVAILFEAAGSALPGFAAPVAQTFALSGGAVAWAGRRLGAISEALGALDEIRAKVEAARADAAEPTDERELRERIEAIDSQIRTAQQQIHEADRRIAEAQAELQRINAGGLVYDFLAARSAGEEYRRNLGLISVIRQDFKTLSGLLHDWNQNEEKGSGKPPIERIVLYIDDLDRCHPDRVVEVLQAVHLLLAFDLFVVIVAVDPRWLERSLYKAYVPELKSVDLSKVEGQRLREFSPQNYLEKIFQIPFSLPGMSEDGYRRLVDDLVTTQTEHARASGESEAVVTGSLGGAGTERTIVGKSPASAPTGAIVPAASGEPPSETGTASPERPPPRRDEPPSLLSDRERAFLQALYAFVPTPRLAKRLVNIYRLLRVRAVDIDGGFERFVAEDGDYRAALLLLALNIGFPRIGGSVLRTLDGSMEGVEATTFPPFVSALAERSGGAHAESGTDRADWAAVGAEVSRLAQRPGLPVSLDAYRLWAPEVGRYAFHWHLS